MKLSTLVLLVPGGGGQSSARNPLEGSAGPDFGSLLSGMAKDAPAVAVAAIVAGTPPTAEATSAGPSVAGVPVPGNGEDQETGSRRRASSPAEGEAPTPDASAATVPPVAGVTSLFTLATRAAEPAQSGAVSASPASDSTVAPAAKHSSAAVSTEDGAKASGRGVRRTSKPDDDGDRAGAVADSVTPVPSAGLVAANIALVPATVPNAADTTQTSSNAAPAAGAGTQTMPPTVPRVAANAAGEIGTAPVLPAGASPVDGAILPETVRVEGHLGFNRSAPANWAQSPRSAETGGAETKAVDLGGSGDRRTLGPPAAALDPAVADAGASNASPLASVGDNAASADLEPFVVPSTATLGTERVEAIASGAAASRQSSTEANIADSAPRLAASTTKPTDEPNTAAADTAGPLPATPVAAMSVPIPQAASPVTQQVADGVAGLAATVVPDETAAGTPVAPARSMALQLSPAGLGTLTVRLHVAGRALDVHLEASDERTAALIDRDRDALSSALRGKDYQLQTLSVTTHDATMPGGTHAERGAEPKSADAGSADTGSAGQRGGGPPGGRSGDGGSRDAPDRTARPSSRAANEVAAERGGSSLFV